jgi:hypothetical protein
MPMMRARVVCGLRDVMLSLQPTSRLSSVDLPTFGRPTIATRPARYDGFESLTTETQRRREETHKNLNRNGAKTQRVHKEKVGR